MNSTHRTPLGTALDVLAQPLGWSDLLNRLAGAQRSGHHATLADATLAEPESAHPSNALSTAVPIELEIGSGKGLFLEQASKSRPQHCFIGIELSNKFAGRAAERLARAGATNALMLRGDAEAFMLNVVPDASLVALHCYFPDPWWRRKHKKRRVLNEETLAAIERSLKPGGQFHFWTDVLDYYELICGAVMEQTRLAGPRYVPERPATHDLDYTTHFERRARRNLQPIYRSIFVKPN